jgi:phytoene desaturase
LVGGGTHPGSGLPVIYSSARITSDLLLGDLGLDGSVVRPRRGRPTARADRKETAAV